MHYGADYNPEQWPEEVWPEDVRLMQEAQVTMVSLGIFAWSRIQPAPGVFDFGWLDRILDLLHKGGIAVDLATATASPPPWASRLYPEMLPVDVDGNTYWPGSRQHFAPASPVYRRLAAELVTEIARRYKDHPAVVLWHVNNEYGCHLNYDYSDAAAAAFRDWLADRYSTIDALNAAWGTTFWSQVYGSFEEVLPPRKAPYIHNPAHSLDFKRFSSDALLECYLLEKQILRDAGATQPITTNFMGAFPAADYWRWAEEVDVVSDDCYPDPNDRQSFRQGAFQRDLMRSLKPDRPWLLMEQATSNVNYRPSNAPKAPGQMAALSYQAVARGADAVMFFQWRQSRFGAEKFHSAMLPHVGTRSRVWREVTGLGRQLSALPQLPSGPGNARVALVFDWHSWWAVQSPDHTVDVDYLAHLQAWYSAAHRLHVQVDFVPPQGNLAAYDVVLAPALYLLAGADAARLRSYVEAGGQLVTTSMSDIADENDRFRDGGFLTQLGGMLGIWLEDPGALALPGAPGQSEAPVRTPAGRFAGTLVADEIHADEAEVLGTFEGGRLDGRPAFTRNPYGAGTAYYVGTIVHEAGAVTVLQQVFDDADIGPLVPGLNEWTEAARRGDVVTVINHGTEPVEVDLPGTPLDGRAGTQRTRLEPFGHALVRVPATAGGAADAGQRGASTAAIRSRAPGTTE